MEFNSPVWESQPESWAIPKISFCREKHRLMRAFVETVKGISCLQRDQMRAVIDGDPDFGRFEALLHMASQRKAAAKYALLGHMERHQC